MRSNFVDSKPSRHVTVSSARGIVTETEQVATERYIIRGHTSSSESHVILDLGSWVGFCYSNAHWSFVKR